MNINSIWLKFKGFINESIRVLRVTKKPDKTEFLTIVKASGLGILIIGLIDEAVWITQRAKSATQKTATADFGHYTDFISRKKC